MVPTVVEVRFGLDGKNLPIDHSYPLYSAISRLLPRTHTSDGGWNYLGIHPVFGKWERGDHDMKITPHSTLLIRAATTTLSEVLKLTGQVLTVNGRFLSLGMASITPITPCDNLFARMVTISGFTTPDEFEKALSRQMEGVACSTTVVKEKVRTKVIKDKKILGFSVKLEGLSPVDSLRVQIFGLGGRRRFGCGMFLPVNKHATS